MAEESKNNETTAFGDAWKKFSPDTPAKGNIDVFPQQFSLKCGKIEIVSTDGTTRNTSITIDGKPAHGVYDFHVHFNTKRVPQLTLGVFLGLFNFEITPKAKK